MTKPLRIFIADDHERIRRGLRELLETQPGLQIVGEAAAGRQAVEMVLRLKPDVTILDVTMPELNGFAAVRQILKSLPGAEILILSMHDSEQIVREALDVGARGFVVKTDAGSDLVAAVETLGRHQPFFSSEMAELVLQGYPDEGRGKGSEGALGRLTPRELQLLPLLAEGKSNKEIAAVLGISAKTAIAHRANIMHKLGFGSLSDLVRFAIRTNIISG